MRVLSIFFLDQLKSIGFKCSINLTKSCTLCHINAVPIKIAPWDIIIYIGNKFKVVQGNSYYCHKLLIIIVFLKKTNLVCIKGQYILNESRIFHCPRSASLEFYTMLGIQGSSMRGRCCVFTENQNECKWPFIEMLFFSNRTTNSLSYNSRTFVQFKHYFMCKQLFWSLKAFQRQIFAGK